jgi:hypothetical protein
MNGHTLAVRSGDVLPHVIGADRQLAVATVHQHGELHLSRPAVLDERVERGANASTGVEDVVHEDDLLVREVEAD